MSGISSTVRSSMTTVANRPFLKTMLIIGVGAMTFVNLTTLGHSVANTRSEIAALREKSTQFETFRAANAALAARLASAEHKLGDICFERYRTRSLAVKCPQ
jgi:hypothetical protein